MRRLALAIVTALLLAVLTMVGATAPSASAAPTCTHTWNGGSGDYREPTNWTPPSVPDPDEVGCLPSAASAYTVTVPQGAGLEAGGLVIGDATTAAQPTLVVEGTTLFVGQTVNHGGIALTSTSPGVGATYGVANPGASVQPVPVWFENHGTFHFRQGVGGIMRLSGGDVTNRGAIVASSSSAIIGGLSARTLITSGVLDVNLGGALDLSSAAGGTAIVAEDGARIENDGALVQQGNLLQLGDVALVGNAVQKAGGPLQLVGDVTGTVQLIAGTTALSGSIPSGAAVELRPTSTADVELDVASTTFNFGALRFGGSGSGAMTVDVAADAALVNEGVVEVASPGGGQPTLGGEGLWDNRGTLLVSADTALVPNEFVNRDHFEITEGVTVTGADGVAVSFAGGRLWMRPGSVLALPVDVYASAAALSIEQLQVDSLTLVDGARLVGAGTPSRVSRVVGDVVNTSGGVYPGVVYDSLPGAMDITGSYTQGTDGELVVQVYPGYLGSLLVGGTPTLGGTLTVDLSYVPAFAQPILETAGGVVGTFEVINQVPSDWIVYEAIVVSLAVVPTFVDVPSDAPFFLDIEWLVAEGITTGYPGDLFKPTDAVTRQAMAAFLYRLAGEPPFVPPLTPTFSDVPADAPFSLEIEWLATTGITTGYADGTFRPVAEVSRQAMAAFLYRFEGSPAFTPPTTPTFSDVPVGAPFYLEIEWMRANGIALGFPDGTYRPTDDVSRQAMSAFLHRVDRLPDGPPVLVPAA